MKTIKLDIPEGYEIDKEKSTFENIVLKKVEVVDVEKEKESKFLELFQGLTMKSDVNKYPNSVFYFRGNDCILELENLDLWVHYDKIWSIFEKDFNMEYSEIQNFIKTMVEKHFKWKGFTPDNDTLEYDLLVEKHFKWDATTSYFYEGKGEY